MVGDPGAQGDRRAQVSGSEPAEMPLRSGGFGSTNWMKPDFDLKLPETEITGQIVSIQNSGKIGGMDITKPVTIIVKHNDIQSVFSIPYHRFKKFGLEVGKTCTIVLQRRPESPDKAPSQIQDIKVF